MKHSTYIVAVDVSSNKCDIDIHKDDHQEIGSFVVNYTHSELNNMLSRINNLVDKKDTTVVMEATGHYHRIVFYRFHNAGFKVVLVNPIQTDAFHKVVSTRKIKTDKIDAHTIALFYHACILQPITNPEPTIELKNLCRAYFTLSDDCSSYQKRLQAILDQIFPLFDQAFSNTFCKTAIEILKQYPTPQDILSEDTNRLILKLKELARKSNEWATNKTLHLKHLATQSPSIKEGSLSNISKLNAYIKIIETFQEQLASLEKEVENRAKSLPQYQWLLSIPGVGPILAATVLGEIGDFSVFTNPKQLVAFAGIDPSVRQSGKFKGSKNKMSKRGSKYLRRVLYMIVACSIRKKRNGKYTNPLLRKYYELKLTEGKKPKVSMGACMTKVTFYIYATLRNQKPFVLQEPNNVYNLKSAA